MVLVARRMLLLEQPALIETKLIGVQAVKLSNLVLSISLGSCRLQTLSRFVRSAYIGRTVASTRLQCREAPPLPLIPYPAV